MINISVTNSFIKLLLVHIFPKIPQNELFA